MGTSHGGLGNEVMDAKSEKLTCVLGLNLKGAWLHTQNLVLPI